MIRWEFRVSMPTGPECHHGKSTLSVHIFPPCRVELDVPLLPPSHRLRVVWPVVFVPSLAEVFLCPPIDLILCFPAVMFYYLHLCPVHATLFMDHLCLRAVLHSTSPRWPASFPQLSALITHFSGSCCLPRRPE